MAGTPGTWKQILPAAVTADPATGTIPTGYLILNITQGTLKRHAGGYSWETVVGATGGKIGFYGVTPVTQPAGADQAVVALGNTDGEGMSFGMGRPERLRQQLQDGRKRGHPWICWYANQQVGLREMLVDLSRSHSPRQRVSTGAKHLHGDRPAYLSCM